MICRVLVSLIAPVVFFPPCFANEWTWRGYEVIGNRSVDCATILKSIPITIGEPYRQDIPLWREAAEKLRAAHDFYSVFISSVLYTSFEAFLVVDVVERTESERMRFRKLGPQSIAFANAEVVALHDKLERRSEELFDKGLPAQENFNAGYLDYDDPEMHELALRLSQLVPSMRENLFDILMADSHARKRATAADLLNYSGGDLQNTADRAVALLDDPSSSVRNYISRFTLHFSNLIESVAVQHRMIDSFSIQLTRPSHADRNKAIHNLLYLGKEFPSSVPYIQKHAGPWVKLLAEKSILSNVQGPAAELVQLMAEYKAQ